MGRTVTAFCDDCGTTTGLRAVDVRYGEQRYEGDLCAQCFQKMVDQFGFLRRPSRNRRDLRAISEQEFQRLMGASS